MRIFFSNSLQSGGILLGFLLLFWLLKVALAREQAVFRIREHGCSSPETDGFT